MGKIKYIKVETQMRSGTHYLLDALIRIYGAKVAKIKESGFEIIDRKKINKGLYSQNEKEYPEESTNCLIFHYHYFHTVPNDLRLNVAKSIFLIGYPFDSFYSDGLVFSSKEYSVVPSILNERSKAYRLYYKSKEWEFLEPYMRQNAVWLEKIQHKKRKLIIRYEDFFIDFHKTCHRIEKHLGPFKATFPTPLKNPTRMYCTNDYPSKLNQEAFLKIKEIFKNSLYYFYPEKQSVLFWSKS